MTGVRAAVTSFDIVGPAGAALRVHDFGGDGPALLFGHATGFHGRTWAPVAEHLLDRHHCWAFDLRGHGGSPATRSESFAWDGFGDDAAAMLAAIGADGAIGVGHSLGAVALLMAEVRSPVAFRELVLYEPAMAAPRGEPTQVEIRYADLMINAAGSRRSRFGSRAEALANYARKRPLSQLQASALHSYVEFGFNDADDGGVELCCRPDVEAAVYRQTRSHDTFSRLGQVTSRVTLVRGALTDGVQARAVDDVAAACGADVVDMDHADHFGPFQQPGQFAGIVRRVTDC